MELAILLAVDPGTTESAFVLLDIETRKILDFDKVSNEELLNNIAGRSYSHNFDAMSNVVIEMVNNQGHSVGMTTFMTCVWIGRFIQTILDQCNLTCVEYDLITRNEVKKVLTGKVVRIKDSHIRSKMIEVYGPPGTKKNPGPTYGITQDCWQALGLAETWIRKNS